MKSFLQIFNFNPKCLWKVLQYNTYCGKLISLVIIYKKILKYLTQKTLIMLNQLSCLIIILTQSYLLKWNSFSSSTTCLLLNVILGRLRLESGIKEQSLLASDMISSSSSRSSADFPELEFGEQVEDVPWLAPESGDLTCRFICIQGNILYIFAMLGLAADVTVG